MGERINENGEWVSPTIETAGITFHYGNTRVRRFSEAWAHLNHVELRTDEGNLLGVRVTEELLQALEERHFPKSIDPYPDDQTQEWYVNLMMNELEAEIPGLSE